MEVGDDLLVLQPTLQDDSALVQERNRNGESLKAFHNYLNLTVFFRFQTGDEKAQGIR